MAEIFRRTAGLFTNRFGRSGGFLLYLICGVLHAAGVDPDLPAYQPRPVEIPKNAGYLAADGAVAVVGYNDMQEMLENLAPLFTKTHPGVRLAFDLKSTRSAPIALAAGRSAFAPMGAVFTPQQMTDYLAATGPEPIGFRVAHTSLDPKSLSAPLAIFVHKDNPLTSLSLDQVARAFTGEATRWGELGLTGEWAQRPIHRYGVEADRPLALELQTIAFPGRAFSKDLAGYRMSTQVVESVGSDPSGIGFAAGMRATPQVRTLAIAPRAGDAPVELNKENVMRGRYPLDRFLLIYVRRPIDPVAREFMRLVYSREGQEAIAASSLGYLPLTAKEAAVESAKLD